MISRSRQLLGFAKIAYLGREYLKVYLEDMGAELLLWINDLETDTQGFVCRTAADEIVIAFRGTEITSRRDRAIDLDHKLVPDAVSGGRVHRGFLRATESIMPMLLDHLQSDHSRPVFIVGHSLGAAIATLVAHRVVSAGYVVTAVHTFGSPRVGDALFAASYNRDLRQVTTRHQNCADIVTRVPSVFQGYHHVDGLIYYDAMGCAIPDSTLLYRAWDSFAARVMHWGRLPTRGIADHLMGSYLNCLK